MPPLTPVLTPVLMPVLMRPWGHQHFDDRGPAGGLPVLMLNSLGTDLRMWQGVCDLLPDLRVVRMDKRGHGLSATPAGDWTLDDLTQDVLALMDHLGLDRALVAGCSVGGMIAQRLAVLAPRRVAGLLLSNTAMKVGTAESWAARIDAVRAQGLRALAPQIMERWFAPDFCAGPQVLPWSTLFSLGDAAGYIGTCKVLAGADLTQISPEIACPALCVAGSADLSTPPGLVQSTAAAIPGARCVVLDGSGHIPAIDAPARMAQLLQQFHKDLT